MSIFAAAAKRWEDGVPGSRDDGIAAIDLIAGASRDDPASVGTPEESSSPERSWSVAKSQPSI
jgi:hypothetical protein